MLNYLWGGFILLGVAAAAFTGQLHTVTTGVTQSAREAVTTCLTMLGVLSMWTGFMNIADKSGLTKLVTRKMLPFLHRLFPDIPKGHKALEHIAANVTANILGLGWASTPAGIYAMQEMDKLNGGKEGASDMMCDFMIFNMFRQYNSLPQSVRLRRPVGRYRCGAAGDPCLDPDLGGVYPAAQAVLRG